jgi:outer membrane protein assembly factor BamB
MNIRRVSFLMGAQALVLSMLFLTAPPAQAAFSDLPDDTWMTNGEVKAMVRAGGHIYIAGKFTQVRSAPPGTPGSQYGSIGVARLDAATGVGDPTWTVQVTRSDGQKASVYAVAVAGGKVWIGGQFDLVNGQPRLNFAALSPTTGELDPTVTASVGTGLSHSIRAMLASDSRLYIGGQFPSVNGVTRSKLAAFDHSGSLLVWRPKTSSMVRALAFDCDGGDVLAGGGFESAGTTGSPMVAREKVARFDAATGALQPWAIPGDDLPNGIWLSDLALSCESSPPRLYGAGGGQNFLYGFDFSTDDTGQKLFERQTSGNVQAVAVHTQGTPEAADDRVLFGGHFGGGVTYPSGTCSASKPKTARFGVVDLDGNCDLSWWPNFEGKFWGTRDILVTDGGDRVWVGGDYTQVCSGHSGACVSRSYLARFTDV